MLLFYVVNIHKNKQEQREENGIYDEWDKRKRVKTDKNA